MDLKSAHPGDSTPQACLARGKLIYHASTCLYRSESRNATSYTHNQSYHSFYTPIYSTYDSGLKLVDFHPLELCRSTFSPQAGKNKILTRTLPPPFFSLVELLFSVPCPLSKSSFVLEKEFSLYDILCDTGGIRTFRM